MKKNDRDSKMRYLGYHIYFKTVKDEKNKRVAKIKNHKIISENLKFENDVLTGVPNALELENKIKKGKIKYDLVSCVSKNTIAKVDNCYNVYTLDNHFLGTLYDSTKIIGIIIRFAIIVMITLIVVFATLPKSGESVKPRELIVQGKEGEIITDHWDIFNDTIHPGETGEYYFKIINKDNKDKLIYLDFSDVNEAKLPMQYRIKSKDGYVSGNENYWANVDKIGLEKVIIYANSSETYILEWRWYDNGLHDEQDTNAATNGSVYVINIKLTSELTTGNTEE